MNKRQLLYLVTIVIIPIALYGCKKNDFIDPVQKCKILETSYRFFTYNDAGDPIRCTYKEDPEGTGSPTFVFVYNRKHQLVAYGGGNEHRLTLNAHGQVIADSLLMNYAGQDDRYVTKFYYDYLGRVRKEVETQYHSQGEDLPKPWPESVGTYNYDRRGNLIQPDTDGVGNLEYDNKPSMLRTHPVFMFIHRNYSVNNPKVETNYNQAGLPDTWHGTFLEGRGIEDQIVYECSTRRLK